jgi:ABC-type transport system involved in cytochrome c biogenesis ATPase subunit
MKINDKKKSIIKITGLHIKGLRAIRSLDLPQEGLGWNDKMPNLLMIGGPNGGGKTTLLEFIARALHLLVDHPPGVPEELSAQEAWLDLKIGDGKSDSNKLRFLLGGADFVKANRTSNCYGYQYAVSRPQRIQTGDFYEHFRDIVKDRDKFSSSPYPSVVFFPSDARDLLIPEEQYKAPGKMPAPDEFIYKWTPPRTWKDSLEALLYGARWEDLNDKEEGRNGEAHRFEDYAGEFSHFVGQDKVLKWFHGELQVETPERERHPLMALSSGEKQTLILAAYLRWHWRPGSLVLIDEPELHLHSAWQAKLYERIAQFLQERGGQVILATQSRSLFELASLDSKLLIGKQAF